MEHIYTSSKGFKAGFAACIILTLGIGLFLLDGGVQQHDAWNIFLGITCIAASVFFVNSFVEKVTVSERLIEQRTLFRIRRLGREDIAGWEVIISRSRYGTAYFLRIKPKDKTGKSVIVARSIKIDATFKTWISAFPNITKDFFSEKLERLKDSPQYERIKERVAPKVEEQRRKSFLSNSSLFASPEELARLYFAQWGL